jgi:hypothetical protein
MHRQVLHAIFEFAMRAEGFGLPTNLAAAIAKRPEDGPAPVETFEPWKFREAGHLTVSRSISAGRRTARSVGGASPFRKGPAGRRGARETLPRPAPPFGSLALPARTPAAYRRGEAHRDLRRGGQHRSRGLTKASLPQAHHAASLTAILSRTTKGGAV